MRGLWGQIFGDRRQGTFKWWHGAVLSRDGRALLSDDIVLLSDVMMLSSDSTVFATTLHF